MLNHINFKNWVSDWEKVDMHLGIFWTLPWDENDKGKWKYKTEKELAQLYKDNFKKAEEKFWLGKAAHLFYQANSILWKH